MDSENLKKEKKALQLVNIAKDLKAAAAVLLLVTGIWCSFADRGFVSTMPLLLLLSLGAFFLYPSFLFHGCVVLVSALFLSLFSGHSLLYSAIFSVIAAALVILAGVSLSLFRSGARKKKILRTVFAGLILFFLLGAQLFYAGTPAGNLAAKKKGEAYLADRYPTQEFVSQTCSYDFLRKDYILLCEYNFEGNVLASKIRIGEKTEDGFFTDLIAKMQEKTKAELIAVIRRETTASVAVEPTGLMESAADIGKITSRFGDEAPEEIIPLMRYNIVFHFDVLQKRVFARYCEQYAKAFREEGCFYGEITFLGGANDEMLFSCRITPETDPDGLFPLCENLAH